MNESAELIEQAPGASWNPFIPMTVAEARDAQSAQRSRCPVAHVAPGMAYVFGAKEARSVLMDHKTFSNVGNFGGDPNMPPFVTLLDPPLHSEVRNLLNQGFSRRAILDASPWISEIVDKLIDAVEADRAADLVSQLSMPLTEQVISRLVGIPAQDSAQLARWSLAITAMLPRPRFDGEEWQRIERYIGELIARRAAAAEQPDDMIRLLVGATIEGRPLTTKEITGHVWLLFVGGLETTAYTLSILLHQLLADRSRWESLVADPSLLGNAVEEGLRFASPLRMLERQVRGDAEVGDCPLHSGEIAFIGLESANFDQALFGDDAQRFRIDRAEAPKHIAFGLGRHSCLGAPLARNEISTAIHRLIERLPGLALAPGFALETVPSHFSHIPARVDVVW